MGSKSARVLARSLDILRIRRNGRYRNRRSDTIINWGVATCPDHIPLTANWLNKPRNVEVASNKLLALRAMTEAGVRCPHFTTDLATAQGWVGEESIPAVVVRHLLRGNSGNGIEIIEDGEVPVAPLYTCYVKKRKEYRVHVFQGEIIDYSCKMLREGSEGNNFQVRSYANGWIFGRDGVDLPQDVKDQAVAAVEALGLDFGAVDVGWNAHRQEANVYEVNTSPGLSGTTILSYTTAFAQIIE